MTRIALFVATLALVVAGARAGLESAVADRARPFLEDAGLARFARFERAVLDPPFRVGARGLSLVDAETGAVVTRLEQLDAVLSAGFDDAGFHVELESLVGRGGRVQIDTDAETIVEVPFIRALIGLVGAIIDLLPEEMDDTSSPMPPLVFTDLEITVQSDDYPLLRYPEAECVITYDRSVEETRVGIDLGPGGELVLVFGHDSIQRVESRDLRVGPSLERILGLRWGEGLARGLAPAGRVDLACHGVAGDAPVIRGELRDGSIHPPFLPVPLQIPEAEFVLADGRIDVPRTRVGLPDGGAELSAMGDVDGQLEIAFEVHETAFRERYLELVPALKELGPLRTGDEGSFDLSLRLRWGSSAALMDPDEVPAPMIVGQGGLHVTRVEHLDTGLTLEDLVGSFTVHGDRLELSRMGARFADGFVEGHGSLGIADGSYEAKLGVLDVDLERLHRMFHPALGCGNDFAGSLQGDLTISGRFDDLIQSRGYGQASVRAGKFMETNLITSIFRRAPVGDEEVRDDQRLAVIYELRDRVLFLDTIGVDLGALGLSGAGTLGERGNLELALVLVRNPGGLFGDVMGFLQRNLLLQVRVEGSLNEPVVRTYPVALITRNIAQALEFFASLGGGEPGEDG